MPTVENVQRKDKDVELKGGHPPAIKAGGMRINQSTTVPAIKNNKLPSNISRAERQQLLQNEDFTHDQEQQIENLKEEKIKEERLKREDKGMKNQELNSMSKHTDKNIGMKTHNVIQQPKKQM